MRRLFEARHKNAASHRMGLPYASVKNDNDTPVSNIASSFLYLTKRDKMKASTTSDQ